MIELLIHYLVLIRFNNTSFILNSNIISNKVRSLVLSKVLKFDLGIGAPLWNLGSLLQSKLNFEINVECGFTKFGNNYVLVCSI